jgi:hypothetical protein
MSYSHHARRPTAGRRGLGVPATGVAGYRARKVPVPGLEPGPPGV